MAQNSIPSLIANDIDQDKKFPTGGTTAKPKYMAATISSSAKCRNKVPISARSKFDNIVKNKPGIPISPSVLPSRKNSRYDHIQSKYKQHIKLVGKKEPMSPFLIQRSEAAIIVKNGSSLILNEPVDAINSETDEPIFISQQLIPIEQVDETNSETDGELIFIRQQSTSDEEIVENEVFIEEPSNSIKPVDETNSETDDEPIFISQQSIPIEQLDETNSETDEPIFISKQSIPIEQLDETNSETDDEPIFISQQSKHEEEVVGIEVLIEKQHIPIKSVDETNTETDDEPIFISQQSIPIEQVDETNSETDEPIFISQQSIPIEQLDETNSDTDEPIFISQQSKHEEEVVEIEVLIDEQPIPIKSVDETNTETDNEPIFICQQSTLDEEVVENEVFISIELVETQDPINVTLIAASDSDSNNKESIQLTPSVSLVPVAGSILLGKMKGPWDDEDVDEKEEQVKDSWEDEDEVLPELVKPRSPALDTEKISSKNKPKTQKKATKAHPPKKQTAVATKAKSKLPKLSSTKNWETANYFFEDQENYDGYDDHYDGY